jgi:hypothetical protein
VWCDLCRVVPEARDNSLNSSAPFCAAGSSSSARKVIPGIPSEFSEKCVVEVRSGAAKPSGPDTAELKAFASGCRGGQ